MEDDPATKDSFPKSFPGIQSRRMILQTFKIAIYIYKWWSGKNIFPLVLWAFLGVSICELVTYIQTKITYVYNMYFHWTNIKQNLSDSTLGKIASKEVLEGNSDLVWSELWSIHGWIFFRELSQSPKATARNIEFEKNTENYCLFFEFPVESFCPKKHSHHLTDMDSLPCRFVWRTGHVDCSFARHDEAPPGIFHQTPNKTRTQIWLLDKVRLKFDNFPNGHISCVHTPHPECQSPPGWLHFSRAVGDPQLYKPLLSIATGWG